MPSVQFSEAVDVISHCHRR